MTSHNNSQPSSTANDKSSIDIEPLQYNAAIIWVCVFIVEALVIITANVLSIMVFSSRKYRTKKSSILMANLAISDLLVGGLGTGFQIYAVGTPMLWPFHFNFHINVLFDMFTGFASLFCLTAIAWERMYASLFPVHYKFLHASKYGIVIVFIWVLSIAISCVAFFVPPVVVPPLTTNKIIAVLLCFCVVSIIFSYTSIGIKLFMQQGVHNRNQNQVNYIKTLFLVTFLSLVSWLPFQVIILVMYISNNQYRIDNQNVVITTKFLQYGNSFVNTIVYYFRMPGFRNDLKSILLQRCQCLLACLPSRHQSRDQIQSGETGNDGKYMQSAVTQEVVIEDTKL